MEAHVRAHPDALGLAVIVANRRGPLQGQLQLQNVVTDQGNMSRAFQQLRFAVIPATDISSVDMMALFHDIASYPSYPPSYKRIAVVFAGHGTKEGLCAHDGVVPIKDIIDQFQPANCHPSIKGIPKLFFIDACRGDLGMGMVVAERGGTAVPSKVVTQYGNSLVAYSTMAGYKAYEVDGRGGMWMSHLSRKLLQDKSILDIMTDINESLMGMLQEPQYQCNGYAQQPTCESNLNETVNLFRESQIGLQAQAAACLPSVLPPVPGPRPFLGIPHSTERSSGAVPFGSSLSMGAVPYGSSLSMGAVPYGSSLSMGAVPYGSSLSMGAVPGTSSSNYRKELNEWCQQNGIDPNSCRAFKESQGVNPQSHMCTITVRRRPFSSEWCAKKKDAEEMAAMRAMLWLCQQQPPISRQQQPVSPVQSSARSDSKPGKARLKEFCDRHTDIQLTLDYSIVSTTPNGPFQCKLTIKSPSMAPIVVTGDRCASIKEAEHKAADKALLILERQYGQ